MTSTTARVSLVTVSDSSYRGTRPDSSGPTLAGLIAKSEKCHLQVAGEVRLVPDEVDRILAVLEELIPISEVIITTGGTGFAPRDVTPEATLKVLASRCSGLEVALHTRSLQATPMAALSRAVAGFADDGGRRVLVVNFPGSVKAVKECWEVLEPIVDHAVALMFGHDDAHRHPNQKSQP